LPRIEDLRVETKIRSVARDHGEAVALGSGQFRLGVKGGGIQWQDAAGEARLLQSHSIAAILQIVSLT
jgi:hypothetical protein